MRCEACDLDLELTELPELRGASPPFTLELYGVKARHCPHPDHPRHYVYPEFDADLLAALLGGAALPVARTKGWLRRRLACAKCGESLADAEPTSGVLRTRVWVERASPCTVTLHGPLLRCPACGRMQLREGSETEGALQRALFDALRSARLEP